MTLKIGNLAGKQLGTYQLRRLIGVGGMAAVYEAFQPALNRLVALKVLSLEFSNGTNDAEHFVHEAVTSAQLEHPNIIPVYASGTQGDISFVAMRLLSGGTLADRLRQQQIQKRPPPSLYEVGQFLTAIAGALDLAHQKHVIHRDIKPSNIMFDADGRPYIVDFGIAKIIEAASQSTNGDKSIIGTPDYMAPEQCENGEIVPATDQYALAGVVYTLLAGHPPFQAPTSFALMFKHIQEPVPPIHEIRPDIPEAVSQVLARAMAKLSVDRYGSNEEFAKEFTKAIGPVDKTKTGFFTFSLDNEAVASSDLYETDDETQVWDASETVDSPLDNPHEIEAIVPPVLASQPLTQDRNVRKYLPYLMILIVIIGIIIFVLNTRNAWSEGTLTPKSTAVQAAIKPTNTQIEATESITKTPLGPTVTATHVDTASPTLEASSTFLPQATLAEPDGAAINVITPSVTATRFNSPTPTSTQTATLTMTSQITFTSTPNVTQTPSPTSTPQATATSTPTPVPTPSCKHYYKAGYSTEVKKKDLAGNGSFFIYKNRGDIGKRPIAIPGSEKGIKNGWQIVVTGASACNGATALYQVRIIGTDAASQSAVGITGYTDRENYLSPDF